MRSLNSLSQVSVALLLTAAIPVCAIAGPTDVRITSDIKTSYEESTTLRAPNDLHVQTIHQIVYLTGLVDTGLQRQMAETIARDIPGVVRVVDSVAVNNQ